MLWFVISEERELRGILARLDKFAYVSDMVAGSSRTLLILSNLKCSPIGRDQAAQVSS